jgi:hypothetical protein
MEKDLDFGRAEKPESRDKQVAEIQDRIFIKILDEVEKGINYDYDTVIVTETIETRDIGIAQDAAMEVKRAYEQFGLPTKVDFFQKTTDDGESIQGFAIEVNLSPNKS